MATPVVAASTVLIRPKLKEMLEKPVLKNLEGEDKIDLTTLTKIALQNTARPMMDPTAWKEKSLYYACLLYTSPSPRDRTRYRMPSSA